MRIIDEDTKEFKNSFTGKLGYPMNAEKKLNFIEWAKGSNYSYSVRMIL